LSLRLAFDLDGVLADMESELVDQAKALFGEAVMDTRPEPVADQTPDSAVAPSSAGESPTADAENTPPMPTLRLTSRQERQLWRHVTTIDAFWESLREIEPGSVARLGALAREHRWEVIFLTKRPESAGATAQVQTQRWLEAKGFPLPSVFVMQGSRGRAAAALGLDFVVDDRPENCVDVVVDSQAQAFLVWRSDRKELPATLAQSRIVVVNSLDECLAQLSEAASPGRRQGFVDRVLRRLGLD
jgi:hypothetical protein